VESYDSRDLRGESPTLDNIQAKRISGAVHSGGQVSREVCLGFGRAMCRRA